MPFYLFLWTPGVEAHVAEHGIEAEDFERIVQWPFAVETSRSSSRMLARGEIDGRPVVCIYEHEGDYIYPVTAFFTKD